MVPAGQLTLTQTGLHTGNNQYTSYVELRNNDDKQFLNAMNQLAYETVDVLVTVNNVDPPVTSNVPMRIPLVDSNQANPDAQSVNDYLDELSRLDPGAFEALAYLEQQ